VARSYRQFCKRYGIEIGFILSLKNLGVSEEKLKIEWNHPVDEGIPGSS
jgi:hypothetical protein